MPSKPVKELSEYVSRIDNFVAALEDRVALLEGKTDKVTVQNPLKYMANDPPKIVDVHSDKYLELQARFDALWEDRERVRCELTVASRQLREAWAQLDAIAKALKLQPKLGS